MEDKIYYHYCSVDTFFNIMQTATLRLGNPLSMNDSAEIIWLLEMVKIYVQEKGKYKKILDNWNLIEKNMYHMLQEIDLPYIFCLSKKNDVLSQWRSYADDGKGVAIGIDVDELLRYSKILSGRNIIYDQKEQMNLLDGKINNEILDNLENSIINQDIKEVFNKVRILVSYVLEEAVVCKNPAFQEENEFRILCIPYGCTENKISEIKFRTDGGSILPYREVKFYNIRHSLIKNITIGPKSKINNKNLWLFLKEQGFKWKEEGKEWSMNDTKWLKHVIISKATYR